MRSLVRLVGSGAALALALCAPAAAELHEGNGYPWKPAFSAEPPGGKATAIVVRIDGGFHPTDRWLWYDADGTARFKGVLEAGRGLYRSRVDFAQVARIVDETGLCTRHGIVMRPVGMDMFTYHVSVRCGTEWRLFTTTDVSEPETEAQAHQAVRALRRLAAALAWTPTGENIAPPDSGSLFHTAHLATGAK